jgi:hypothetical protein
MNVKIKAVGAYYTPDGVVADSPKNPKYAEYTVNEWENTYELIITASYAPAAVSLRIPVEIDAGDTYAYDTEGLKSQKEREAKAAERIFGMLPEDQRDWMFELFHEFEEGNTPEARFARSLDNVQPVMQNDASEGKDWQEKGIRLSQAIERQRRTAQGSQILWDEVSKPMLQKNIDLGNIIGDVSLDEI